MTRDQPFDGDVVSTEDFHATLTELCRVAHQNDVEVEGGWEIRNGAEVPDWEAMIVEITKSGSD